MIQVSSNQKGTYCYSIHYGVCFLYIELFFHVLFPSLRSGGTHKEVDRWLDKGMCFQILCKHVGGKFVQLFR